MEDCIMDNLQMLIISAVVTAFAGYFFGAAKTLKEQKRQVYAEALGALAKLVYHTEKDDQDEINKMLLAMALYSNKKVYKKLENVIRERILPGNTALTPLVQELAAEMRKDVQVVFWQWLRPEDINHLFIQLKAS